VPLFALANAGIHLTGGLIGKVLSSPITLGIVLAYVARQDELTPNDLTRYADELGLDSDCFEDELLRRTYAGRVRADVMSGDESGASGTPTFFINGSRDYGVYDIDTLTEAVRAAKTRARQLAAVTAPDRGPSGR
jgi:predicted DsbA family dithiol-disulfide isomerase